LARHNFDVRYITEVLSYARRKFPMISTNRTFVFGSGLGADMALLLACNMSEAFGAVISHNGKGLVRDARPPHPQWTRSCPCCKQSRERHQTASIN
jgi:enterochelin esterase-like enzyme